MNSLLLLIILLLVLLLATTTISCQQQQHEQQQQYTPPNSNNDFILWRYRNNSSSSSEQQNEQKITNTTTEVTQFHGSAATCQNDSQIVFSARQNVFSSENKDSSSSLTIIGQEEVIISVDPVSGKQLWSCVIFSSEYLKKTNDTISAVTVAMWNYTYHLVNDSSDYIPSFEIVCVSSNILTNLFCVYANNGSLIWNFTIFEMVPPHSGNNSNTNSSQQQQKQHQLQILEIKKETSTSSSFFKEYSYSIDVIVPPPVVCNGIYYVCANETRIWALQLFFPSHSQKNNNNTNNNNKNKNNNQSTQAGLVWICHPEVALTTPHKVVGEMLYLTGPSNIAGVTIYGWFLWAQGTFLSWDAISATTNYLLLAKTGAKPFVDVSDQRGVSELFSLSLPYKECEDNIVVGHYDNDDDNDYSNNNNNNNNNVKRPNNPFANKYACITCNSNSSGRSVSFILDIKNQSFLSWNATIYNENQTSGGAQTSCSINNNGTLILNDGFAIRAFSAISNSSQNSFLYKASLMINESNYSDFINYPSSSFVDANNYRPISIDNVIYTMTTWYRAPSSFTSNEISSSSSFSKATTKNNKKKLPTLTSLLPCFTFNPSENFCPHACKYYSEQNGGKNSCGRCQLITEQNACDNYRNFSGWNYYIDYGYDYKSFANGILDFGYDLSPCTYCSYKSVCVARNQYTRENQCACLAFDGDTCLRTYTGMWAQPSCSWCNNFNLCIPTTFLIDANFQKNSSSNPNNNNDNYNWSGKGNWNDPGAAVSAKNKTHCHCADLIDRDYYDVNPHDNNNDIGIDLEYCEALSDDVCRVHRPLFTLSNAPYFCAPGQMSCSAVVCTAIVDPATCVGAGCRYLDDFGCVQGECFNFFMPGVVSLPYVLLFGGIFKNVVVLLLTGVIADRCCLPCLKMSHCCKKYLKCFWCFFTICCYSPICCWFFENKYDKNNNNQEEEQQEDQDQEEDPFDNLELKLDETCYILDGQCRDDTNVYASNFEDYCFDCWDLLFIPVSSSSSSSNCEKELSSNLGDDNNNTNNDNNNMKNQDHLREVLISSSENNISSSAALSDNNNDNNNDSSSSSKRRSERMGSNLTERNLLQTDERITTRRKKGVAAVGHALSYEFGVWIDLNEIKKKQNQQNNKKTFSQTQIFPEDFDSLYTLQQKVNFVVRQHASYFINYNLSRKRSTAAFFYMHSFPTRTTLQIYIGMLVLIIALISVTIQKSDTLKSIVNRTNEAGGCLSEGDNAATTTPVPSSNNNTNFSTTSTFLASTTTNPNNNQTTAIPEIISTPQNLNLLGALISAFIFCNSNTFFTCIMILVKLVSNFCRLYIPRLDTLTFAERLPILQTVTNRAMQLLTGFFVTIVCLWLLVIVLYGTFGVNLIVGLPVLVVNVFVFIEIGLQVKCRKHVEQAVFELRTRRALMINRNINNSDSEGLLLQKNNNNNNNNSQRAGGGNGGYYEEDEGMPSGFFASENQTEHHHYGATANITANCENNEIGGNDKNEEEKEKGFFSQVETFFKTKYQQHRQQNSPYNSTQSFLGEFLQEFFLFALTELIPMILLFVTLQVTVNYMCYLSFAPQFGLEDDAWRVLTIDLSTRSLTCLIKAAPTAVRGSLAAVVPLATPFLPFM